MARASAAFLTLLCGVVLLLGCGGDSEETTIAPPEARTGKTPARDPLFHGDGHYRIARVRVGAEVAVLERPAGAVVDTVNAHNEFNSRTTLAVTGRRGDYLRVTSPLADNNKPLWIEADPETLRFYTTEISIHVDLATQAVEIDNADGPFYSFKVTIGAPGTTTPSGRFAVTDAIVGGLSPVYGCCAVALSAHQSSLPAGWLGGDRVAIHGTTGPIGGASSSGCLRATDDDVRKLIDLVPLGAPVFVSN